MSKIIVEVFDVFHNFMSACVRYILPLNYRKFVHLTHLVGSDSFTIFVPYDKENFGDTIQQFIQDIINEAQKSDLYIYHWKVHLHLLRKQQISLMNFFMIVLLYLLQQYKKN